MTFRPIPGYYHVQQGLTGWLIKANDEGVMAYVSQAMANEDTAKLMAGGPHMRDELVTLYNLMNEYAEMYDKPQLINVMQQRILTCLAKVIGPGNAIYDTDMPKLVKRE